jgi:hypothetical protein
VLVFPGRVLVFRDREDGSRHREGAGIVRVDVRCDRVRVAGHGVRVTAGHARVGVDCVDVCRRRVPATGGRELAKRDRVRVRPSLG